MPGPDTLLEFPCRFRVKVMGRKGGGFTAVVSDIVRRHAPRLRDSDVAAADSREGRFVSLTFEIDAVNRAQLDALYHDLNTCERVIMTL